MAVRRQCNRYTEPPYGYDYEDVLKRGKAWHKHDNFEMQPFVSGTRILWTAERETPTCYSAPNGTRFYRWNGKRWEEYNK